MLAGDIDKVASELFKKLSCYVEAVDVADGAATRPNNSLDGNFALLVLELVLPEKAFDPASFLIGKECVYNCFLLALADDIGLGLFAKDKTQGTEEYGFAGAGLTGNYRETLPHLHYKR